MSINRTFRRNSATSPPPSPGNSAGQGSTAAVLKCMDREYRGLLGAIDSPFHTRELRFGEIVKRVESRSSYAYGRHVRVEEEGGYVGITDGLDSRGFLRVQTDHGLRMVISGSVRPMRRSTDAAGH